MSELNLIGGLDIGNGCVKGGLRSGRSDTYNIDMPSSVARANKLNRIEVRESEAGAVIDDIYNQMNVSFNSPAVDNEFNYWFGDRAVRSGGTIIEFSVENFKSKAEDPLSAILVLGTLAGRVLQEYWDEHKALPGENELLNAHVWVALALPIGEFSEYYKRYAALFMQSTHMVVFHNFEHRVQVCLSFANVQVFPEGASAQFAIASKGVDFMDLLLADCRKNNVPLEGVTGRDMIGLTNIVGIDIGEGTVNFPVFKDGDFNPDASRTLNEGYGNMLENCLQPIQRAKLPSFLSRKQLSDYLRTDRSKMLPAKQRVFDRVVEIVKDQSHIFATSILSEYEAVMRRVGADVDAVYVYGGGATPMKEMLYPLLIDHAKDFGGGDIMGYPVLYLDSAYSRYLNREGLLLIANTAAQATAAKADAAE